MSLTPTAASNTPAQDKICSLGELRTAGRARGDNEKKALYFLLKQTRDAWARHERHEQVKTDPAFLGFCEEKNVPPSTRQARKFLNRKKRP